MNCMRASISPYRNDRKKARFAARRSGFHEVFVTADLATAEVPDRKRLYRGGPAGRWHDFTGIDAPHEEPESAELIIDMSAQTKTDSLDVLMDFTKRHNPIEMHCQLICHLLAVCSTVPTFG
jgi:adenylylsulfate kinase-like enzyme